MKMNNKQRAKAFKKIGQDFIDLHNEQELTSANIAMENVRPYKKNGRPVLACTEDVWACDTICCVGGWANILYGSCDGEEDYSTGADLIAIKLGFVNGHELKNWAAKNPFIWDNRRGSNMFCCSNAYNSTDEEISLKIVGEHFIGVGERLGGI